MRVNEALASRTAKIDRLKITLNGDPFELAAPRTVSQLLAELDIDARRVAVEHNLVVLKRAAFDTTTVQDGDQIEIVNFVGGGSH
jgi:thiazole synthase